MNTQAKRAFSVHCNGCGARLVTVISIIDLAEPVSAIQWNTADLSGPSTGFEGDTLTYTARVYYCKGDSSAYSPTWCDPIRRGAGRH